MQNRKTGQSHRIRGVIGQIRPLGFKTGDSQSKSLVVQQRVLERAETVTDGGAVATEVLANHLHDRVHAELIFVRQTTSDVLSDAKRQQRYRDEHDRGKCHQHPGPQRHR